MKQNERYQLAKKITILGALTNALLGSVKMAGGFLFHSHALIADGAHSFADLFTDIMVIFASKYGSLGADSSHPYGHQRIETAATLILALLLILTGAGIAWDSLTELYYHSHDKPASWALLIAITSILANEALFIVTKHIGQRIKSDLIIANAWHHRSDAASSLVVLVGLIGSYFGYIYLDSVAAIIVGLMIIHMGASYGWNSVKELVDTAADPNLIAQVIEIIEQIKGIHKIHQLRSRSMGPDVYLDVHIQVSPYISVSEGHFIAQRVHHALVEQIDEVQDVTVHVDPEDDETVNPSIHLPPRPEVEKQLILKWKLAFDGIDAWKLHYLDGKISIDLFCATDFKQVSALKKLVQADIQELSHVKHVRVYSLSADVEGGIN